MEGGALDQTAVPAEGAVKAEGAVAGGSEAPSIEPPKAKIDAFDKGGVQYAGDSPLSPVIPPHASPC